MFAVCKCGNFKTIPPYKIAGATKWICDDCAAGRKPVRREKDVIHTRKNSRFATFMKKQRG